MMSTEDIAVKNILVLIDIQNEYITLGRPFYLKGI
jgi:hypothetical protein